MARPQKAGMDYFPLDTDFLSHDKRIKGLLRKFGTDGITFLISLWCDIYGGAGYYVLADEDYLEEAAHELGISLNTIRQIVDYLLSRSLFDNTLFQSVKVLTAPGIQRRFQLAVKERVRKRKSPVIVEKQYWLLPEGEEETVSVKDGNGARLIKVIQFSVSPRKNEVSPRKNEDFPRRNATKESKGKKSKEKNKGEGRTLPRPHGTNGLVLLTDEEMDRLVMDFGKPLVDDYIARMDRYCRKSGKTYFDCAYTLRSWIQEDRDTPKNNVKNEGDKSRSSSNRFHNFKEHDYDYDALMRQAIQKNREE